MVDILHSYLSNPLEREYESWITTQIEDYFNRLGIKFDIWAVSPLDESTWPADEHVLFNGKLLGLQFKQAKLKDKIPSFNRLRWDLRQPKGQFEAIQKRSEIFYALPTFINRKWRKNALEHCVFWRPNVSDVTNYNLWYSNNHPSIKTPYNNIANHLNAFRWGHFVELIINCNIGYKIDKELQMDDYLKKIKKQFYDYNSPIKNNNETNFNNGSNTLYLLHIKLNFS
ncbi:hypothetical protein M3196_13720 [Fictibacillus nanhaiensis]|uniref:hypothetical protein n=1 Tax=Fictibacillus nanhaiensis TaxID=742169 RepID=UPI00203CE266|nr:hypothetical protein [Fictibacillus nanhaiensis]MCM3732725.1 hypothetical protein [Fictibacillus nanhaiensis]